MQRIRSERGATAVMVALLMIPLLGFAAITVDVGAMYAEKSQLQNGADAAALAIAQDCAMGEECTGSTALSTANEFAVDNVDHLYANDNSAEAEARLGTGSVKIDVFTLNADKERRLDHFFAPVLELISPGEFDSSEVNASATAVWGNPSKGPVIFPLTFSRCAFEAFGLDTTNVHTLVARDNSAGADDCPLNNKDVPGGFGWLDPTDDCSSIIIDIATNAESDPGKSVPSGCKDQVDELKGTTAFFPIFEDVYGQGNNATYDITGFAAFKITGWNFPSLDSRDSTAVEPCGNNINCVQGYFVRFVEFDEGFETSPDAEDFGAYVVALTE